MSVLADNLPCHSDRFISVLKKANTETKTLTLVNTFNLKTAVIRMALNQFEQMDKGPHIYYVHVDKKHQ